MTQVEDTLTQRGKRYGRFDENARVALDLTDYLRRHKSWELMPVDAKQALTTIMEKIARILNGDPDYEDNWHDIQGYAKLVEDRILKRGTYANDTPAKPLINPNVCIHQWSPIVGRCIHCGASLVDVQSPGGVVRASDSGIG